jgi:hypothetical protein
VYRDVLPTAERVRSNRIWQYQGDGWFWKPVQTPIHQLVFSLDSLASGAA